MKMLAPVVWGALGFGMGGTILVVMFPSLSSLSRDSSLVSMALVDGQTAFAAILLASLLIIMLIATSVSGAIATVMVGRALEKRRSVKKLILIGAGAFAVTWLVTLPLNGIASQFVHGLVWGILAGVIVGKALGRTQGWSRSWPVLLTSAVGLGLAAAALYGVKYELADATSDSPLYLKAAVVALWAVAGALIGGALRWQALAEDKSVIVEAPAAYPY